MFQCAPWPNVPPSPRSRFTKQHTVAHEENNSTEKVREKILNFGKTCLIVK